MRTAKQMKHKQGTKQHKKHIRRRIIKRRHIRRNIRHIKRTITPTYNTNIQTQQNEPPHTRQHKKRKQINIRKLNQ